jgi:hypothetical protein
VSQIASVDHFLPVGRNKKKICCENILNAYMKRNRDGGLAWIENFPIHCSPFLEPLPADFSAAGLLPTAAAAVLSAAAESTFTAFF